MASVYITAAKMELAFSSKLLTISGMEKLIKIIIHSFKNKIIFAFN